MARTTVGYTAFSHVSTSSSRRSGAGTRRIGPRFEAVPVSEIEVGRVLIITTGDGRYDLGSATPWTAWYR